jgi:hypothetical protein
MGRRATGQIITTPNEHGTSYAVRFTAFGKRRFQTIGHSADGMTRADAERELQHIMADVQRGLWQPPAPNRDVEPPSEEANFHEFASEWWEAKRPELAENTQKAYLWHLRDHLLPFFKDHRLSEITHRGG